MDIQAAVNGLWGALLGGSAAWFVRPYFKDKPKVTENVYPITAYGKPLNFTPKQEIPTRVTSATWARLNDLIHREYQTIPREGIPLKVRDLKRYQIKGDQRELLLKAVMKNLGYTRRIRGRNATVYLARTKVKKIREKVTR